MNLRPVEHFFPHFDLFAMSKSSMYLMCQIHWIVSGSLNYRSFRDITAGNIQMPPLRWWAESTLPHPPGRDRAKVTKNLGATSVAPVVPVVTMAIRVVEFSNWGTKLERFLPKNHHTERKLLNFENWINGGLRSFQKSEF